MALVGRAGAARAAKEAQSRALRFSAASLPTTEATRAAPNGSTNGAAEAWLKRSPSAFTRDVLRRRSAAAAAAAEPQVEPSTDAVPPVQHRSAGQAPRRKTRTPLGEMPLRIIKHRYMIRPARRLKSYAQETRIWQLAAWLLTIVHYLIHRVLGKLA